MESADSKTVSAIAVISLFFNTRLSALGESVILVLTLYGVASATLE